MLCGLPIVTKIFLQKNSIIFNHCKSPTISASAVDKTIKSVKNVVSYEYAKKKSKCYSL